MEIDTIQSLFEPLTFHAENGFDLPYRLFRPRECSKQEQLPLLIQIHGMGSVGSDNCKQLIHGIPGIMDFLQLRGLRAVIAAPQAPARWVDTDFTQPAHVMHSEPTPQLEALRQLIHSLTSQPFIAPDRGYVSGISMGGFAAWELLQRDPHLFSAALILCAGGDPAYARRMTHLPIWCVHGALDRAVLPVRSRTMRDAINALGGDVILSEYPDRQHDVWTPVYSDHAYLDWLFSRRKQRIFPCDVSTSQSQ